MSLISWLVVFIALFWAISYFSKKDKKSPGKEPRLSRQAPATDAQEDALEGTYYEALQSRVANRTVKLRYSDARGIRTDRTVSIHAYEPTHPQGMFRASCHTRKAQRTFRFDRVERAVDPQTGEIFPDLQAALNADWDASPESALQRIFDEYGDLLKLMFYMAKADGAARKAEVDIITQQCRELSNNPNLTNQAVKEMLQILDLPTLAGFTKTFGKLRSENPELASRTAAACRAIVATQKTIHPSEQLALDVLSRLEVP